MKISVNGDHIGVYHRDEQSSFLIDSYLLEGNNYIKLIPEDDIDIVDLTLNIERIRRRASN